MRIYKKLFSCLALFLLCIVCLLTDVPKVWAAEFLTADDGIFLYMNSRELAISDEEEGVQFFLADDGTLQLMNKNTQDVYKTFVPLEQGMVGYRVRDVFTANPENIFFEINATIGAHAQNCGYWLIGKENGQWLTYVTLEDLAKNGYAIDQWRQIVIRMAADVLFCSANMNICLRKLPSACREDISLICGWSFCGMMLRKGLLCANYNVCSKIMGIA